MNGILEEYWQAYLWSDGPHFSGLAVTLWLLILSVVIGSVVDRARQSQSAAALAGLVLHLRVSRHAFVHPAAVLLHRGVQPACGPLPGLSQRVLP